LFLSSLVTGHANFHMEKTALTVGGFTQPSVARTIIEQTTGAERGFSQRFLWIFPKPTFAKFDSLQPVSEENISCMHHQIAIWYLGYKHSKTCMGCLKLCRAMLSKSMYVCKP